MLNCILSHLAKTNSPIIPQRELTAFPQTELRHLRRQGILEECLPPTSIVLPLSRRRVSVRQTSDGWIGLDEDDLYFAPVALSPDDVKRWRVDVPHFVDWIRRENEIDGTGCEGGGQVIPIGTRDVLGIGRVEAHLALACTSAGDLTVRCQTLSPSSAVAMTIVLTPQHIPVSQPIRDSFQSRRLAVVSIWATSGATSPTIDWSALARPDIAQDTVVSPNTLRWRGREHKCDLTKSETVFLTSFLTTDEIDVHMIMHPREGAAVPGRYSASKGPRDHIHKFLNRLNRKLLEATPPIPFSYSLPRHRHVVIRLDAVEHTTNNPPR